MVDAANSATSTAGTTLDLLKAKSNPSVAETASSKLSDDFDNFLLLLTTQLKNQDPTEPLDTNEFTGQLVQFTVAEQAVSTNQNLEKLIEMQKSGQFEQALAYVGRTVDAKGNAGELSGDFANFIYELDAPANTVNIVISDGAGRAVFSGQGPTQSGKNRVVWDGVNSFNGQDEPEGTYFINIIAKNGAGETVTSRTFTTGVVTSAEMQGDEMVLNVAGTTVKVSEVEAVRLTTQLSAAPQEPEGDETTDDTGETDETETVSEEG